MSVENIMSKRKEPGKRPKRRRSAYIFFSVKRNSEIEGTFGERSRIISAEWKALTDEEKAPYKALAEEDGKRAERELQQWLDDGGEDVPKKKVKKKRKPPTKREPLDDDLVIDEVPYLDDEEEDQYDADIDDEREFMVSEDSAAYQTNEDQKDLDHP